MYIYILEFRMEWKNKSIQVDVMRFDVLFIENKVNKSYRFDWYNNYLEKLGLLHLTTTEWPYQKSANIDQRPHTHPHLTKWVPYRPLSGHTHTDMPPLTILVHQKPANIGQRPHTSTHTQISTDQWMATTSSTSLPIFSFLIRLTSSHPHILIINHASFFLSDWFSPNNIN